MYVDVPGPAQLATAVLPLLLKKKTEVAVSLLIGMSHQERNNVSLSSPRSNPAGDVSMGLKYRPQKWGEGHDPARTTRSGGGFGGRPQPESLVQRKVHEFEEHGAGTRASFTWSFKYYWRALYDLCVVCDHTRSLNTHMRITICVTMFDMPIRLICPCLQPMQ